MAFPLHLLERVAVDTGGSLGNSRHGTEWLAAGGTESSRGEKEQSDRGVGLVCDA